MTRPSWTGKLYLIAFPRPRSSCELERGHFFSKKENRPPAELVRPGGEPFPPCFCDKGRHFFVICKTFPTFFLENAFFLYFFLLSLLFSGVPRPLSAIHLPTTPPRLYAAAVLHPTSNHPPHRRACMPSAVLHPTSSHPPHAAPPAIHPPRAYMPPQPTDGGTRRL